MGIYLFIGYAPNAPVEKFFTNTDGEEVLSDHAESFTNINDLLDHLKTKYKSRKAYLTGISKDMPEEARKKVENLLETLIKIER